MERNRCWRRKKNFSKGRRKKNIVQHVFGGSGYGLGCKHDGQYIKGKVHRSNPLYSMKTNNRRCYGVAMNWKHRDAQKVLSMDSQEEEFNNEKEIGRAHV